MANSKRVNKNRNGQLLIPMNVDGGVFEESFITSGKVCAIIALLLFTGGMILWSTTVYLSLLGKIILFAFVALVDQFVLRYIIFEEKYYYRMYKKLKNSEITTPAIFWNIVSMKETEDGTVLCYGDGKIATLIKIERDTIIGKNEEFRETHFDAISDFYKELNLKNLKFVQMNLMEQAGKDPRIQSLNELTRKPKNKNISKIIESQVGYIKKITRATLFETDYFLIYTEDMNRSDTLISDALDCVYKILGGAYISYEVCNTTEILDVLKEQYGINYFDYTEATASMFKNFSSNIGKTYDIYEVRYTDGSVDAVDKTGNNRIINLTSCVMKETVKFGEWSVKEALKGNLRKENLKKEKNFDADFDDILSDIDSSTNKDLDDQMFESNLDKFANKAMGIIEDIMYGESTDNEQLIKNNFENLDEYKGEQLDKSTENSNEKIQLNINKETKNEGLYLDDDEVIDLN